MEEIRQFVDELLAIEEVRQIGSALLAILVGVSGTFALFLLMEFLLRRLPRGLQQRLRPWAYIGPALAILGFYLLYPVINTLIMSFMSADSSSFVGLDNYSYAVTNPELHIALRNNLLWIVFVTTLSVGLGLTFAVLFDRVRYESVAKTFIFLPMAISAVGASVIWRFVYEYRAPNRPQVGLLNAGIKALGGDPVAWTIERPWNNFALMGIQIWLVAGFCMVILSAALKGVPREVLEAARVDGANEWQVFRRIIVPMISSTIAVVTTTVIIGVLKVFDIVYVMTNGNHQTEVIANRIYKEMYQERDYGHASAVAVLLLLAIIPVMAINIRRFRQQEAMR